MKESAANFPNGTVGSRAIAPRQRLVDESYRAIREMIITNELQGGQVISVSALAEYLGVSRSPVSKAFTALEQDGFVESEPFKAPRVAILSTDRVREIYEARTALEGQAAASAVANISDSQLESLAAAYADIVKSGPDDDRRLFKLDVELHSLLIDNSRNRIIRGFLGNLELHLDRIRNVYGQHVYSDEELGAFVDEIGSIVEAAEQRDGEAVAAAMRAHVGGHSARLIAKIGDGEHDD